VTELAWLLATVTGIGVLENAVSYKDKIQNGIQASVGLFTYPVLMAADILAYDTDLVPVGADQVQHVELARHVVRAFNAAFGEVFRVPRHEVALDVPVPGIDGRKMSKSYGNTIEMFASGEALRNRVAAIKTGSLGLAEPKDPTACAVFALHALFSSPAEQEAMARRYRAGGYGYGHAKQALIERIEAEFGDARDRYAELIRHPDLVETALAEGARRARAIARATTDRAREAAGV
jgi:tryptophanyl-tRNA synthetase